MGIYPERRYDRQTSERRAPAVLHTIEQPGIEHVFIYELVAVIEKRTDCYCCSCGEGSSDPACRNHGFAAKRPCEQHDMPGTPWGDELEGTSRHNTMPASVQEVRRQHAETERQYREGML